MLTWIREKFGTLFIGTIIAFIAFVFIFYGVFNPKATRGLHQGAVAGTVNGESISIKEFQQEYNRKIELFKKFSGSKLSSEQLKQLKIQAWVFQDLVRKKLMIQDFKKKDLRISAEALRAVIEKITAFQKNQHFDLPTYQRLLAANHLTPRYFESQMQDDLILEQWSTQFQHRIQVSPEEVKREFQQKHHLKKLQYVLIANPTQKQDNAPAAERLADQILTLWTKPLPLSQLDKETQKLLKGTSGELQTTGWIHQAETRLPRVGEASNIILDAFSSQNALQKPKKYPFAERIVVVRVLEEQMPVWKDFESQQKDLATQIEQNKSTALYQSWLKNLLAHAKVIQNPAIIQPESGDTPDGSSQ